jgi:hypothetical protein
MGGMQGMQGMSGMQGMEGMGGMQGMQGMSGMQGMEGMSGMQGMQGMSGMEGMTGMQGLSAEERDAMLAAHYKAMRERAKAAGIDLPETPPAKLMTPEERRAHWEKMQGASPEERQAARAETYKQLRERAKAQGSDLPETPPWEQAQQRRKAMQEKWEAYRKQVEAMTEEQREAARAIFGGGPGDQAPPMPMERPMPQMPQMPMREMSQMPQMPQMPMREMSQMPQMPQMPMREMPQMPQMPMDMPRPGQGPQGFGPGPCPHGDCGMGMPPRGMMPGWGGQPGFDQAPPQGGPQAPWGRGY